MKQRIAEFLGELAEELGWTPDPDHELVSHETPERTRPAKPIVVTPDPHDLASLATPVEHFRAELGQLHATVKHLGAEITQLRAQMAQLRGLPTPPDAADLACAVDMGAFAARNAPQPRHRTEHKFGGVSSPAVITHQTDSDRSTVDLPGPRAPESVNITEDHSPDATSPTVIQVDGQDSALEMFPPEPNPSDSSTRDQADPGAAEVGAGAAAYAESRCRWMGGC